MKRKFRYFWIFLEAWLWCTVFYSRLYNQENSWSRFIKYSGFSKLVFASSRETFRWVLGVAWVWSRAIVFVVYCESCSKFGRTWWTSVEIQRHTYPGLNLGLSVLQSPWYSLKVSPTYYFRSYFPAPPLALRIVRIDDRIFSMGLKPSLNHQETRY